MQISATGAENLVSMGVKVSFDPELLEVVDAVKHDVAGDPENAWRMTFVKEDGTTFSYNTPEVEWDNTSGTVSMIGGHLYKNKQTGSSTEGLSGTVLLGWIDFRAKALGTSDLYVDLARYHPNHPSQTYDNFVKLNQTVDEPTNVQTNLGAISVSDTTCAEPQINDIAFDCCISEPYASAITVSTMDPCGGNLTYTWEALDGGTIDGSGHDVTFHPAGTGPCPHRVKVTVASDAGSLSTEETIGIYVKLTGDADGSGRVDIRDKRLIRDHFGETPNDPNWDPRADVDCSGRVDIRDKRTVRDQFGDIGCQCP